MEQSQLLAHWGSSKITREELKVIPTPAGSATHQPLPHFEIVGALVETLSFRQISVVREEYAVTGDGMKMFGVLDLETTFDGCRFSVGVRNSNDKSMRLALTVGYRVLVCGNMAFHGDFATVTRCGSLNCAWGRTTTRLPAGSRTAGCRTTCRAHTGTMGMATISIASVNRTSSTSSGTIRRNSTWAKWTRRGS